MLLTVGNHIKFALTGEEGTITELLGEGMVFVRLADSGMEIPAFIEDLLRVESDSNLGFKAKIVQGKHEKKAQPPLRSPAERQYVLLKEAGLQLAFLPQQQPNGSTSHYELHLINATQHELLFAFALEVKGKKAINATGKLMSGETALLGALGHDSLSDQPDIAFSCWRVTTQGTEGGQSSALKIRPKQFFKNLKTAPLLDRPAYLFLLFASLDLPKSAKKSEDLREYAKRNARSEATGNSLYRPIDLHDLEAIAHFKPELDLHIEKLTSRHGKMNNSEILQLQLRRFEEFLQEAQRVGAERVFIIHGLGSGRLRAEVADRLDRSPAVIEFKNEYHPRYGFGATEAILG
jgi:hypothetical protein